MAKEDASRARALPTAPALVLQAPEGSKAPRVPLALDAWSAPDAAVIDPGLAIVLRPAEGSADDALVAVAAQVPAADTIEPGRLVLLFGEAARRGGLFTKVFGGARGADVPRAVRASALLARGYVALGAAVDPTTGADLVWGRAPT